MTYPVTPIWNSVIAFRIEIAADSSTAGAAGVGAKAGARAVAVSLGFCGDVNNSGNESAIGREGVEFHP